MREGVKDEVKLNKGYERTGSRRNEARGKR